MFCHPRQSFVLAEIAFFGQAQIRVNQIWSQSLMSLSTHLSLWSSSGSSTTKQALGLSSFSTAPRVGLFPWVHLIPASLLSYPNLHISPSRPISLLHFVFATAQTIGIVNILNSTMRCPVSFHLLDMQRPPVLTHVAWFKWSHLLATAPFSLWSFDGIYAWGMFAYLGSLILNPVSYLQAIEGLRDLSNCIYRYNTVYS